MMSFLSLVRYFVAMALLYTCIYQEAEGRNKTVSYPSDFAGPSVDGCTCYYQGKTYSLGPLERDDGKPRFPASAGSGRWMYSYNPCRSFSLGPPQQSDCFGDVAVCRWTKNKARYQNIGKQSSVYCGFNKDLLTPQLVYTNKDSFPEWKVIVNLKCDPAKKTAEEADFDYIRAANNIWEFLLASICACPNGCPSDPGDKNTAKPPADGRNKLEFVVPICALSFFVFAIPLFIYRKRICQWAWRQNDQGNEREPLNHGRDGADYVNDFDEERRLENSRNVHQPSLASSGSSNQISGANEKNKDNLKRGSNRHQNTGALAYMA